MVVMTRQAAEERYQDTHKEISPSRDLTAQTHQKNDVESRRAIWRLQNQMDYKVYYNGGSLEYGGEHYTQRLAKASESKSLRATECMATA
jgi:hypothetical protein